VEILTDEERNLLTAHLGDHSPAWARLRELVGRRMQALG
jgi:hypothetical protein